MKKLLCLFSALFIALTSCSSEDPADPSNPTPESEKLQFDVDGKTFVSTSVQAIVSDNQISISGINSTNGEVIIISIPANKIGTYTFSNKNLALAYKSSSDAYASFVGLSESDADDVFGNSNYEDTTSVTITSIDSKTKKISGIFHFTGIRFGANNKVETKTFSKGSFTDITFTEDTPVKDEDSFSTKLDGTNFVPTTIFATSAVGKINIAATRGSVENIAILIPNNIQTGTYNVGDSKFNYVMRYGKNLTAEGQFEGKGTLVILSHNTTKKTISGTFKASFSSYSSTEKHEISEGLFNISY